MTEIIETRDGDLYQADFSFGESESLDKFLPAWLAFQREMDPATKSSENIHLKSTYANLREVFRAVKGPLFDQGFCFTQLPRTYRDGSVSVRTKIWHVESGQWMVCVLKLRPEKATPQGVGSAITYAKRYSMEALTGLESEDDDGNKASGIPAGDGKSSGKSNNQGNQSGNKNNSNGKKPETKPAGAPPKTPPASGITKETVYDGSEAHQKAAADQLKKHKIPEQMWPDISDLMTGKPFSELGQTAKDVRERFIRDNIPFG